MPIQIEEDAATLLAALADAPRETSLSGQELHQKTALDPHRINDAMALLVESGLVEWQQVFGTAPYDFGDAEITARGRYEHQRTVESRNAVKAAATAGTTAAQAEAIAASIVRPPAPVGSPFGFTDEDWEVVAERKGRQDQLRVVLGYQFASDHYDSEGSVRDVAREFSLAERGILPSWIRSSCWKRPCSFPRRAAPRLPGS